MKSSSWAWRSAWTFPCRRLYRFKLLSVITSDFLWKEIIVFVLILLEWVVVLLLLDIWSNWNWFCQNWINWWGICKNRSCLISNARTPMLLRSAPFSFVTSLLGHPALPIHGWSEPLILWTGKLIMTLLCIMAWIPRSISFDWLAWHKRAKLIMWWRIELSWRYEISMLIHQLLLDLKLVEVCRCHELELLGSVLIHLLL